MLDKVMIVVLFILFGIISGFIGYILGENKKSDWVEVWADQEGWEDDDTIWAQCSWTIYYSKSRKKYKLEMEGYRPRQADKYPLVIAKFNEFNTQIRNSDINDEH